jgi:DDE superfamily endonuclease
LRNRTEVFSHTLSYAIFLAQTRTLARRLLQRLEFHYTPKHGSWLNMAEIEIAILERNALSRRLQDEAALRRQVGAVVTARNQQRRGIAWQFTSRDARGKLERLYPVKAPASD